MIRSSQRARDKQVVGPPNPLMTSHERRASDGFTAKTKDAGTLEMTGCRAFRDVLKTPEEIRSSQRARAKAAPWVLPTRGVARAPTDSGFERRTDEPERDRNRSD